LFQPLTIDFVPDPNLARDLFAAQTFLLFVIVVSESRPAACPAPSRLLI
jgi:hypothetical protein